MIFVFWLNICFCRVCNATTPEIARNLSDTFNISRITSRNRTTMMSSEIAQLQSKLSLKFFLLNFIDCFTCCYILNNVTLLIEVPRKKVSVSKQSIIPSQLLDAQKRTDIECKDLELGLLYDEYLQTIMMDLVMKKKTEEKKRLIVTQLVTVEQEIDRDMQKLIKIKTRERDIINLSLAQKEADAQLIAVTKCTSKIKSKLY